MQPLPAITAVKTVPASAAVRSATAASSVMQSTEHSVAQSTEQAPVAAYADEQALRQQQAAAEQDAAEQLTDTQLPDSGQPATEWSGLSQPLSAEELALLYRQPLISSGFSQPLPPALAVSALPADNLSAATAQVAVATLMVTPPQQGLAATTNLVTGQTLAEPMLTQRQSAELLHVLSAGSLQALRQQAVLAATGTASQNTGSELPPNPLVVSQPAGQHGTLQHSMALTVMMNRQLNTALSASTDSTTVAAAVHTLSSQATTTASPQAQWQSEPLPTEPARFGQRLLQLLHDKVDLQLGLGLNKALIRLDPPSLGSIELSVQLDGDKLQVQLHSSNAQLREAMGQGLEQLRASLQQKLGSELQIELQLGADGQLPQHANPAWVSTQISSNGAEAEPATQRQTAEVERRNYLNQLV